MGHPYIPDLKPILMVREGDSPALVAAKLAMFDYQEAMGSALDGGVIGTVGGIYDAAMKGWGPALAALGAVGAAPVAAEYNPVLQEADVALFDDGVGNFGDFGLGDFGVQDIQGAASDLWGGIQQVSQVYSNFAGGQMDDSGNAVIPGGDGGMVQTGIGSAVMGVAATGGVWLGSLLARAFGRTAAAAVFTAANGVRVRIAQLWPLVRRYGAQNVAGALGITVGALGTLLMQPGARTGARKRRRGISARDVTTTRRTIRQLRKLTQMAGIGGGGRSRSYRSYRPRRRSRGYYC